MNDFNKGLVIGALAFITFIGGSLGGAYLHTHLGEEPQTATVVGAALPQGVAIFETALADRITPSATSMTLVSNTLANGQTLSGYQCFTLDEGRTDSEYVCGVVSGTSVTSLERGISLSNGTTTIPASQFAHRRVANVKITDFPLIQRLRNMFAGTETIPTLMQYVDTVLITGGSPTTTVATKYYVDNVVSAGAADASETTRGIIELSTTAEAAAGTSLGATTARLVPPNSMYNATPSANVLIPVTSALGKLAQGFLDIFTTNNTWTGGNIFGNATTTNATSTSQAILNVTFGRILKTNSIGSVVSAVPGTDYVGATWAMASSTATSTGSVSCSNCGSASKTASSSPIVIPAGIITASSTIHAKAYGNTDVGTGTGNVDASCSAALMTSDGTSLGGIGSSNGINNDDASWGGELSVVMRTISTFGNVSFYANEDTGGGGSGSGTYDMTNGVSLRIMITGTASASGGDSMTLDNCTLSGFTIEVNP